jgi:hypothetical protein
LRLRGDRVERLGEAGLAVNWGWVGGCALLLEDAFALEGVTRLFVFPVALWDFGGASACVSLFCWYR